MASRSPIKKNIAELAILCCLMLPVFIACGQKSRERLRPVAIRGIIDLRGWDFERDGSATLDGEWEFY